jgi:hypothetical protein
MIRQRIGLGENWVRAHPDITEAFADARGLDAYRTPIGTLYVRDPKKPSAFKPMEGAPPKNPVKPTTSNTRAAELSRAWWANEKEHRV